MFTRSSIGSFAKSYACRIVSRWNRSLTRLSSHTKRVHYGVGIPICLAKLENVVKWNIYIVEGQPIEQGLEVFQRVWGKRQNPPVITTVYVSKLANPDFLVEIDAVAVVL